jgi:tRNA dimethylallyltransferase
MEALSRELPLVVIVGPTASGKTDLSIKLAEQVGGEIVCADSRTIYKGMDIGTAKPTKLNRERVPHWGLDLVEPNEPFSASDFKEYADAKITEIRSRGKIPFLVGGSGLYVDAVLFDYKFGSKADDDQRALFERLSPSELIEYCKKKDILLPENLRNKRYLIRAIERQGQVIQRRAEPINTSIIVGIATDKAILRQHIATRSEQIFTNGIVEEATMLGKKYGINHEAMTGNIYPIILAYTRGECSMMEAKDKFTTSDWHLAKRQMTWFRRNPYIIWLSSGDAFVHISSALADL